MLINSKVTNNNYPVKNTELTLNVPEKVEAVKVTARNTNGTNSKAELGGSAGFFADPLSDHGALSDDFKINLVNIPSPPKNS